MEADKEQPPERRPNETRAFDPTTDIPFPSIVVRKLLHFTQNYRLFYTELMTHEKSDLESQQ